MACMPRTTLKYEYLYRAEHLSGLCIWCFLPLSSIQLTTGCWKVLSAISLSVITTLALCSDPGLSWRARGHVPFHNAASSLRGTLLFHKGWCFEVMFLLFPKQWVTRKVEQTKKKRVAADKGSVQSFQKELWVHLNWCQDSLTHLM